MGSRQGPFGLLDLPVEVLQIVFWHMDPGTLFSSLLTCKEFFDAAKSRRVLLRQLRRIPGLNLGLDDVPSPDLFLRFRKRAAQNLCGARLLADITKYASAPTSLTRGSQWIFAPGAPAQLATIHDFEHIRIYELTQHHVRLKVDLRARCSDVEAIKLAFSANRDLAVLYRNRTTSETISPFVDEAVAMASRTHKLVTFHHLHATSKGYFYSASIQETRDIPCVPASEPVGLALASNGNACIAWRSSGRDSTTEVVLYGRDSKTMDACNYGMSNVV